MSRTTALFASTIFTFLVTGGALSAQVPPAPTPAPCPLQTGKEVPIAVDRDATASPDCVRIRKGKSRVVWTGGEDVRLLLVAFKDPVSNRPPEDPACSGARCVLEKAKHALKQGEFAYSIVVVRQDGSIVQLDPKLIIDP
ncbi:MAG: hypothetical protein KJ058_05555 [Thermoanaerobaculia bacterium]|nr:hypothetical protein [Thermoanaerobaculia bacterium]MCZ7652838.1 hypothetical protein [Thermoanaerobaculia bacterium]